MDKAVEALDVYMTSKTVHATSEILRIMALICQEGDNFTDGDAHQDFAQRCRNFEIHSDQNGMRSWGRNQFEAWWNDDGLEPFKLQGTDSTSEAIVRHTSVQDIPYMMPDNWERASMQELIAQLEYCGYGCEAGVLVNNVAFQELKRRIGGV